MRTKPHNTEFSPKKRYNNGDNNSKRRVNANMPGKRRKQLFKNGKSNNSRKRRRRRRRELKRKHERMMSMNVPLPVVRSRRKPQLCKEITSFNTNVFRSTNARKKHRRSKFSTDVRSEWKKKYQPKQSLYENSFWNVTTQTKLFTFHSKIKVRQMTDKCKHGKATVKSSAYKEPQKIPVLHQSKYVDKYKKHIKIQDEIEKNIAKHKIRSNLLNMTAKCKFLSEIRSNMTRPRKNHRPNIVLYDFINAFMNKQSNSAVLLL